MSGSSGTARRRLTGGVALGGWSLYSGEDSQIEKPIEFLAFWLFRAWTLKRRRGIEFRFGHFYGILQIGWKLKKRVLWRIER